jgi:hypothetical protein
MLDAMPRKLPTCALFLYGLAVAAVPAVIAVDAAAPDREAAPADREAVRDLAGIWWRWEPGVDGDPVRFYYFHGDGKGLYRYGRVGLTNTNSFDYDVDGETLVLTFRKSGVTHRVPFRVEHDGDRDWLALDDDPREPGATRYFRDQPGPIDPHNELGRPPAGHMWIDFTRYATGGNGFSLYQFRSAGIDGRGVGWFHRGDFDDWETESLTYRLTGNTMDVTFTLRGDRAQTRFEVLDTKPRTLHLDEDPRDFWHPHDYTDVGKSFGQVDFVELLDVGYSRTE